MIHKIIYFDQIRANINFYVGENAKENHYLVLESDPEDLWFHLRRKSSPHVLAITNSININRKNLHKIIVQGSLLCKQNSQCKSEKNVEIVYTKVKNVIATETLGMVEICNANHICI